MFNNRFQIILPDKKEQDELSRIEVRILRNQVTEKDVHSMEKMIKKLIERGSEVVVLGCTDLQSIIKQKDFDVEIIDTLDVLIDSSFWKMIGDES